MSHFCASRQHACAGDRAPSGRWRCLIIFDHCNARKEVADSSNDLPRLKSLLAQTVSKVEPPFTSLPRVAYVHLFLHLTPAPQELCLHFVANWILPYNIVCPQYIYVSSACILSVYKPVYMYKKVSHPHN